MIKSFWKYGINVILLAVVITSVLQFHHHDCQGHITFTPNIECANAHIHIYSKDDNQTRHNHDDLCLLTLDSQVIKFHRIDFAPSLLFLTGILPHLTYKLFDSEDKGIIFVHIIPKLSPEKLGLALLLRAPPYSFMR